LATISLILRRRWKQARKAGRPTPASRDVNIAYPYFGGTLVAASVHPAEDTTYFWGLCALIAWALWTQRSRRFAVAVWLGALVVAVALGFLGQRSIGQLQRYLENFNAQWMSRFTRQSSESPIGSRFSFTTPNFSFSVLTASSCKMKIRKRYSGSIAQFVGLSAGMP
jgi:hypothetical protein